MEGSVIPPVPVDVVSWDRAGGAGDGEVVMVGLCDREFRMVTIASRLSAILSVVLSKKAVID